MNKINYGLVGEGERAFRHAHAVSLNPGSTLLSLYSKNPERGMELRKIHSIPYLESDMEYMLEREEIDGVILALPSVEHFEGIKYVLDYSKAAVVDFPLTLSESEAEMILSYVGDGYFIFNSNPYLYMPGKRIEGENYTLTLSTIYLSRDEKTSAAIETVVFLFGPVLSFSTNGDEIILFHSNTKGRIVIRSDYLSSGLSLKVDGKSIFYNLLPQEGLGHFYSYVYDILENGGEMEERLLCSLEASRIVTKLVP